MVVTGAEGTGKSVVCEFLREFVLGPAVTAFFDGVEDMVEKQKHNRRKAGKRLWVLEECTCRSMREDLEFIHSMDSLKRLVTNPVVTENPKGQAIREVDDDIDHRYPQQSLELGLHQCICHDDGPSLLVHTDVSRKTRAGAQGLVEKHSAATHDAHDARVRRS